LRKAARSFCPVMPKWPSSGTWRFQKTLVVTVLSLWSEPPHRLPPAGARDTRVVHLAGANLKRMMIQTKFAGVQFKRMGRRCGL
jgi:hypothetical protein